MLLRTRVILCMHLAVAAFLVPKAGSCQPLVIPDELDVHVSRTTGWAALIKPKQGPLRVSPKTGRALATSADVLGQYGALFGIRDLAAELGPPRADVDELGFVHETYLQMHNGIPVFAGMIKVHRRDGAFVAANGNFYPILMTLNPVPTLDPEAATRVAVASLPVMFPVIESRELVIVDPGWYGSPPIGPRLAYYLVISDPGAFLRYGSFVDAHSGILVDRWDMQEGARNRQVHDAAGIPGNVPGPLVRWEGRPPAAVAEVNRAFDYAGDTYDYYFRGFGRDSLNGAGIVLRATVRALVRCPNAFFGLGILGYQAVFCRDFTTDDIVGHEFTHGVTRFSANLLYLNQPGQLNESFSDVFGELVDLFNGNAAFAGPPGGPPFWPVPLGYVGPGTDVGNNKRPDNPARCSLFRNGFADGVRWLLGEDNTWRLGRDLWNPPCFGQPDRLTSFLYRCGPGDNGGVHLGSGVPNHAFAILTDGKVFNGQNVNGIGPIKAGAVWYRALTRYLTPASNFQDAFLAFQQAAQDLVGTQPQDPRTGLAGPLFTMADAGEVEKALRAVEMHVAVPCGFAARSFIYLVDTTGSAAGANAYYNAVILALTRRLARIPAPTQYAIARFDDYPCAPHGEPVDVPYQLITPFVAAPSIPGFLPVTGPGRGLDTPESQIDAIVTALTGRALVPNRAGCGPGVPAGQGAFPAGAEKGPVAVILFTRPPLFHLPGAGKPHVNGVGNVTAVVNIVSGVQTPGSPDAVLTTLIDVEFDEGPNPVPASDQTDFKSLLTAVRDNGGNGGRFVGTTGQDECVANKVCVLLGGGSACLESGDTDSDGDGLADHCGPLFPMCDLNGDADVDSADINIIFQGRGVPATPDDPRDADRDGTVTVNDARLCTLKCSKPNCAP